MAFNILSLGLDAFVTHMTNRMKGALPGDSYKLWVNIAALFYERLYGAAALSVRAFDEDGRECAAFHDALLLLAMGASGGRTYGSGNRILPDERNVCAVRTMSLFRKLALKNRIARGLHAREAEVRLLSASRLVIEGEGPLLAQMDGETLMLSRADFPLTLSLSEPFIPTLSLAEGRNQKFFE